MRCQSCGRDLGDGGWQVCPGCGADLKAGLADEGTTARIPVPAAPGARQPPPPALGYQPASGPTQAMPAQQYQQLPYAPAMTGAYAPAGQPYAPGYTVAAPGGSVLLGLLTMLFGAAVAGSTFLQWVASPQGIGAGVSITGWFVMRVGFQAGGGFSVLITEQGTIFFTGFFSLLLGALVVTGGILTMVRRRPGGILTLIFALAASAVAAIDITMVFAKMESSPGVGLWLFAGASVVALTLGIVSLSSSS